MLAAPLLGGLYELLVQECMRHAALLLCSAAGCGMCAACTVTGRQLASQVCGAFRGRWGMVGAVYLLALGTLDGRAGVCACAGCASVLSQDPLHRGKRCLPRRVWALAKLGSHARLHRIWSLWHAPGAAVKYDAGGCRGLHGVLRREQVLPWEGRGLSDRGSRPVRCNRDVAA